MPPAASGLEAVVGLAVVEQVAEAVDRVLEDRRPGEDQHAHRRVHPRDGLQRGDEADQLAGALRPEHCLACRSGAVAGEGVAGAGRRPGGGSAGLPARRLQAPAVDQPGGGIRAGATAALGLGRRLQGAAEAVPAPGTENRLSAQRKRSQKGDGRTVTNGRDIRDSCSWGGPA